MIPASIRNHNPGAMYPGTSSKKFGSSSYETLRSKDGVHKIATFPSPIQGAAAMLDLLDRSYRGLTIERAIARWCGGFYVSTYLKVLEAAGVTRSTVLTYDLLRDPAKVLPLVKAMALQEAGREFPLSDEEWARAHVCAFAESVAPAFSPDNDVPSPKPETRRMETVKRWSWPLGLGAGGITIPQLPAPPDLSAWSGWQAVIDQGRGLAVWSWEAWPWVIAATVIYLVLGHALPWLARRGER